jgi:hypothetical protein
MIEGHPLASSSITLLYYGLLAALAKPSNTVAVVDEVRTVGNTEPTVSDWTYLPSDAMLAGWFIVACATRIVRAVPQAASITTAPTSSAPTITEATSVASPTAPLTATLPSQVALPPLQPWCPSEIFCAGAVRQTFLPSPISSSSYNYPFFSASYMYVYATRILCYRRSCKR